MRNKEGELRYLTDEFSVLKSMSEGNQPYPFFVPAAQEEGNHLEKEEGNCAGSGTLIFF